MRSAPHEINPAMTSRFSPRQIAGAVLAVAALAAAGYLVLRAAARPVPPHPWFAPRAGEHRPLAFAHQGGARLWPANTLLAFRNSAALGADVIDTDLHLTRDGALVLMHDALVDRTTDGSGRIADMTLAELKRLDAGYRFSPDSGTTTPWRGKGLTVPTLDEALAALPGQRFGIEMKDGDPALVAPLLCDALRRRGMQRQALVSSFTQDRLDALRAACPEVATSASAAEARRFYLLHALGLAELASPAYQSLQVPARFGAITLASADFIADAHARGLTVQIWTVSDAAEMSSLIALGVDGINSDFPDRLLALLR
jgi:glycerophosphoryl diester phosphodiesterase